MWRRVSASRFMLDLGTAGRSVVQADLGRAWPREGRGGFLGEMAEPVASSLSHTRASSLGCFLEWPGPSQPRGIEGSALLCGWPPREDFLSLCCARVTSTWAPPCWSHQPVTAGSGGRPRCSDPYGGLSRADRPLFMCYPVTACQDVPTLGHPGAWGTLVWLSILLISSANVGAQTPPDVLPAPRAPPSGLMPLLTVTSPCLSGQASWGLHVVSVSLSWLLWVTSTAGPPRGRQILERPLLWSRSTAKGKSPGPLPGSGSGPAQRHFLGILSVRIKSQSQPGLDGAAGQSRGHREVSFDGAKEVTVHQD